MFKKHKKYMTDGIPSGLLNHLKTSLEYCDEGMDVAMKISKLVGEHAEEISKGEIPEEMKDLLVRSSELVILIETTKAMGKNIKEPKN